MSIIFLHGSHCSWPGTDRCASKRSGARAGPPSAAKVVFLGPTRPEDMAGFYRAIDVLVVPSRTESFSRVAAEAMVCGVSILGSMVGGLAELLIRSANQKAQVNFDDPEAAARAVVGLLGDGDLRQRRALVARRSVLSFYTSLPKRWLTLVGRVAGERDA